MGSLRQHLCAFRLLACIHLSSGVLWEDRPQASENVTRETRPAQRGPLHSNSQEVLLRPLCLHCLFCPVSRGQSVLHKNPDHRNSVLLGAGGRHSQWGGFGIFCLQQLPRPRHVLPVILFGEEGGAALGEPHVLPARCCWSQREHLHWQRTGKCQLNHQFKGEGRSWIQTGSETVSLYRFQERRLRLSLSKSCAHAPFVINSLRPQKPHRRKRCRKYLLKYPTSLHQHRGSRK